MENCDKCGSKIEDGKCSCGIWIEKNQDCALRDSFNNSIEHYNKLSYPNILGGDHYSGSCFVFFPGDFDKCEKVKEFIQNM